MREKILFLIGCGFLCAVPELCAQIKCEVLRAGYYSRPVKELVRVTPETTTGFSRLPVVPPSYESLTNRIPARLGIRFTFDYRITGLSPLTDAITITKVVKHPPIRLANGKMSEGFTIKEEVGVEKGEALGRTGYGFDRPEELVTGIWRFELFYRKEKLCEVEFEVYSE